jgi:hypothetical protein
VGENALLKLISVLRINEPRFSKYDFLELRSPEEEREDKTRRDETEAIFQSHYLRGKRRHPYIEAWARGSVVG